MLRRTGEGLSKSEIIRCLKRYVCLVRIKVDHRADVETGWPSYTWNLLFGSLRKSSAIVWQDSQRGQLRPVACPVVPLPCTKGEPSSTLLLWC